MEGGGWRGERAGGRGGEDGGGGHGKGRRVTRGSRGRGYSGDGKAWSTVLAETHADANATSPTYPTHQTRPSRCSPVPTACRGGTQSHPRAPSENTSGCRVGSRACGRARVEGQRAARSRWCRWRRLACEERACDALYSTTSWSDGRLNQLARNTTPWMRGCSTLSPLFRSEGTRFLRFFGEGQARTTTIDGRLN